jgi:hypothetical protein
MILLYERGDGLWFCEKQPFTTKVRAEEKAKRIRADGRMVGVKFRFYLIHPTHLELLLPEV